jgi:rubrerythrin
MNNERPSIADSAEGEMSEAEIDYNVMESFPASDPPAWTLGLSPHKKERSRFNETELSPNNPTHQNQPDHPHAQGQTYTCPKCGYIGPAS